MKRRRNVEAFSLSFLDCICCGFGAIILLLVLSKIYEPVVIEKAEETFEREVSQQQGGGGGGGCGPGHRRSRPCSGA